jgi:hypothetical protein
MDARPTLDELGHQYGTDKASGSHDYLDFYQPMLEPMRDKPIVFLEIGVAGGASLKMWHDYFTEAFIFGMDISPSCADVSRELSRGVVTIGDQSSTEDLARAAPELLHVVNDDASHDPGHQVFSYKQLLPRLAPGGLYLLEDIGNTEVAELLTRMARHCIMGSWAEDPDEWIRNNGPRIESMAFFRETSATRIKKES